MPKCTYRFYLAQLAELQLGRVTLVVNGLLGRREGLRDGRLIALIGDGLCAVGTVDVGIVELALGASGACTVGSRGCLGCPLDVLWVARIDIHNRLRYGSVAAWGGGENHDSSYE